MDQPNKIRIAILGGGLAGVCLLRGLMPYPHLDVSIYESRPEFKEEGAGIGLQVNAIDSLRAISPALVEALDAAGAVATNGARIFLGCGPNAGAEIDRGPSAVPSPSGPGFLLKNVGRHAFLQQLLAPVPASHMHASKKLGRITGGPGPRESTLHFADGTSSSVDVVIGADGIHGQVRKHVLGQDSPSTKPQYAGWWHTACLVPLDKALPILGAEVLDVNKPFQYIWIGERGQVILHDFVHGLKFVQCIIGVRGDKTYDPQNTPNEITREQILNEYSHWPDKLGKDYVNLLCDHAGDPVRCWPQLQHKGTPTYVTGNAALVGDAAHSTTPWQGSGGAMAIEDALVLSRLLGRATSTAQVPAALAAYDKVRRPRTQRVIESSFGSGMLMSGRDADAGLDRAKLGAALAPRWDFIRDFDAEKHVAEAVKIMDTASK